MLLTVDDLNITPFCFYVSQIVIVVVITFIGQRSARLSSSFHYHNHLDITRHTVLRSAQRTLGKHLDESTLDKCLEEESLCTAHFRFPI